MVSPIAGDRRFRARRLSAAAPYLTYTMLANSAAWATRADGQKNVGRRGSSGNGSEARSRWLSSRLGTVVDGSSNQVRQVLREQTHHVGFKPFVALFDDANIVDVERARPCLEGP